MQKIEDLAEELLPQLLEDIALEMIDRSGDKQSNDALQGNIISKS